MSLAGFGPEMHVQDSDCTIDPAIDTCSVCGVDHSGECARCHGRGYHTGECPRRED
jgi:hypothetical protein